MADVWLQCNARYPCCSRAARLADAPLGSGLCQGGEGRSVLRLPSCCVLDMVGAAAWGRSAHRCLEGTTPLIDL